MPMLLKQLDVALSEFEFPSMPLTIIDTEGCDGMSFSQEPEQQ